MVQIAQTNIVLSGYKYIVDMVRNRASTMKTPFCLHLDHGKTFEENIQLTKKHSNFVVDTIFR